MGAGVGRCHSRGIGHKFGYQSWAYQRACKSTQALATLSTKYVATNIIWIRPSHQYIRINSNCMHRKVQEIAFGVPCRFRIGRSPCCCGASRAWCIGQNGQSIATERNRGPRSSCCAKQSVARGQGQRGTVFGRIRMKASPYSFWSGFDGIGSLGKWDREWWMMLQMMLCRKGQKRLDPIRKVYSSSQKGTLTQRGKICPDLLGSSVASQFSGVQTTALLGRFHEVERETSSNAHRASSKSGAASGSFRSLGCAGLRLTSASEGFQVLVQTCTDGVKIDLFKSAVLPLFFIRLREAQPLVASVAHAIDQIALICVREARDQRDHINKWHFSFMPWTCCEPTTCLQPIRPIQIWQVTQTCEVCRLTALPARATQR